MERLFTGYQHTTTFIISVVIIIIIAILAYPAFDSKGNEGFSNNDEKEITLTTIRQDGDTKHITKDVYRYVGGPRWSGESFTSWKEQLSRIHSLFHALQDNMQDVYATYRDTEGELEKVTRKKYEQWLKMTLQQRVNTGMTKNPLDVYYTPLKSQSQIPYGGLPDNEGELPTTIENISLPPAYGNGSVNGGIPFGWKEQSDQEKQFYKMSKQYVNLAQDAINKLDINISRLHWSVNGNNKASLFPRIRKMKKDAENAKQSVKESNKSTSEGFFVKTKPMKPEKEKIVRNTNIHTIHIYPYNEAYSFVEKSFKQFESLQKKLDEANDDIIKANQILKQLNEEGQKARNKIKASISS